MSPFFLLDLPHKRYAHDKFRTIITFKTQTWLRTFSPLIALRDILWTCPTSSCHAREKLPSLFTTTLIILSTILFIRRNTKDKNCAQKNPTPSSEARGIRLS